MSSPDSTTAHTLTIDPEIHGLIPPLSDGEREQLEENIARDGGILSPGVAWQGILLDGHNRREIAAQLGIAFPVVSIDLPDRVAALMWVVHHQEGRRNLTDFARSEMALKLKAALAADAEARMRAGKVGSDAAPENTPEKPNEKALSDPPQNSAEGRRARETRERIADAAGVSRDTIRKVETVKAKGSPKLIDAARKGRVSINAAAAIATLPAVEQERVVEAGADAVKQAAKVARQAAVAPITEPAEPWAAFNTKLDGILGDLRSAAHQLHNLLEVKDDRIGCQWAADYSLAGTVRALNTVVRNLEAGRPAAASPEPPGFLPARVLRDRERFAKSA